MFIFTECWSLTVIAVSLLGKQLKNFITNFCNTKLDFYFLFGGVVFEILMRMVFVELLIQLPVLFSILYFIGRIHVFYMFPI